MKCDARGDSTLTPTQTGALVHKNKNDGVNYSVIIFFFFFLRFN